MQPGGRLNSLLGEKLIGSQFILEWCHSSASITVRNQLALQNDKLLQKRGLYSEFRMDSKTQDDFLLKDLSFRSTSCALRRWSEQPLGIIIRRTTCSQPSNYFLLLT